MLTPSAGQTRILSNFRRRARDGWMIQALAILLLAQAAMPIQAHSRWAVTDDGQVVELCTLQGTVPITVHLDGEQGNTTEHEQRSAAMLFSLLLGESFNTHAELQPAWIALYATSNPPIAIIPPAQLTLRLAFIRAPPSLV